jgi:hypothetical protein
MKHSWTYAFRLLACEKMRAEDEKLLFSFFLNTALLSSFSIYLVILSHSKVINYLPNRALSLHQALDANGSNTCYIAAKAVPFMEFLLKENKKYQQKKLDVLGKLFVSS